jgi:hypothetical protein
LGRRLGLGIRWGASDRRWPISNSGKLESEIQDLTDGILRLGRLAITVQRASLNGLYEVDRESEHIGNPTEFRLERHPPQQEHTVKIVHRGRFHARCSNCTETSIQFEVHGSPQIDGNLLQFEHWSEFVPPKVPPPACREFMAT